MAVENLKQRAERWKKAVITPLPDDFLRISQVNDEQETTGSHVDFALCHQQAMPYGVLPNHIGRLSITCAQARLARNYGITRMDPYCRIRLGHYVYETQTDPNGGKNPRWNRVIQSQLPLGVNSLSIEIYDECSFKMDELIAWCEIQIPESVLRGETHEEWYPLSGKQGEGLEGAIDVVLSFTTQILSPYMFPQLPGTPMLMLPSGRPTPVYVASQIPSTMPLTQTFKDDLKQMHEMFPDLDKEVIKTVYEANAGNKDATINSLLRMSEN